MRLAPLVLLLAACTFLRPLDYLARDGDGGATAGGTSGTAGGASAGGGADAGRTCDAGWCVKSIATGSGIACAIDDSERVLCWPGSDLGQPVLRPLAVAGITQAVGVTAGYAYGCAWTRPGEAQCWGAAHQTGNLGADDPEFAAMPSYPARAVVLDGGAALRDVTGIAIGESHACAVTRGQVACWGHNEYQQVTARPPASNRIPIAVPRGGPPAERVAASPAISCQLGDAGVGCWGSDNNGQITGTPQGTERPNATPPAGLTRTLVRLAACERETCGVSTSRELICWGGEVTVARPPALQPDVSNVVEVTCRGDLLCVVDDQGQVWCRGPNDRGQRGVGFAGDAGAGFTQVQSLPPAEQVAAGFGFACAVTRAGEPWCWGSNDAGQLGDSTTVDRLLPARVAPPQ